jgi:hypothetical protein
MSKRADELIRLKEKAAGIKREFENEINRIINEMDDREDIPKSSMYRSSNKDIEDIKEENLEEYEKKLEVLKDELKRLKKIKKQQKKISKLEEERMEVIKEIERKRIKEKKMKHHK